MQKIRFVVLLFMVMGPIQSVYGCIIGMHSGILPTPSSRDSDEVDRYRRKQNLETIQKASGKLDDSGLKDFERVVNKVEEWSLSFDLYDDSVDRYLKYREICLDPATPVWFLERILSNEWWGCIWENLPAHQFRAYTRLYKELWSKSCPYSNPSLSFKDPSHECLKAFFTGLSDIKMNSLQFDGVFSLKNQVSTAGLVGHLCCSSETWKKSIKKLEFRDFQIPDMTHYEFARLLGLFPNLEEIMLSGNFFDFTSEGFPTTNLKKLQFYRSNITLRGLEEFKKALFEHHFPGLENLTIDSKKFFGFKEFDVMYEIQARFPQMHIAFFCMSKILREDLNAYHERKVQELNLKERLFLRTRWS